MIRTSGIVQEPKGLLDCGPTLDQRAESVDCVGVGGLEEPELFGVVMVPGLNPFVQELVRRCTGRGGTCQLFTFEDRAGHECGSCHEEIASGDRRGCHRETVVSRRELSLVQTRHTPKNFSRRVRLPVATRLGVLKC